MDYIEILFWAWIGIVILGLICNIIFIASDVITNRKDKIMNKEKKIEMVELELDMDEKTAENLEKLGLEMIKKDKNALINYAANVILKEKMEKK